MTVYAKKHVHRAGAFTFAVFAVLAACANQAPAQTVSANPPKQPPLHIVYHLFFGQVNALQAEARKAGESGTGFRDYYLRKLNLTHASNSVLISVAAPC